MNTMTKESLNRRPPTRSIALGCAALITFAACDAPLPGDEVCRDIGYSIANRVFECNGDPIDANAQYSKFIDSHPCLLNAGSMPSADHYKCSQGIMAFSCDQAKRYGTDYDTWLANAGPGCALVYAAVGGGALPAAEPPPGTPPPPSTITPAYTLTMHGQIEGRPLEATCNAGPNYAEMSFMCRDATDNTIVSITWKVLEAGTFSASADVLTHIAVAITYTPAGSGELQSIAWAGWTMSLTTSNVTREVGTGAGVSFDATLEASHASLVAVQLSATLHAVNVPCAAACPGI